MTNVHTGRVKTVLVTGESAAVITDLVAKKISFDESSRLSYSGSVKFNQKVQDHLKSVILPQIDEILIALQIPKQSYEITVVNPGATTSSDLLTSISGFSIDFAVYLALLSISLDLPVKRGLAVTGHISSSAGDVSPVSSMAEKCLAVLEDEGVHEFVFADIDVDDSFQLLKPEEYESHLASIRSLYGQKRTWPVKSLLDLVSKAFDTKSNVLSSLNLGYFGFLNRGILGERFNSIVHELAKDSDKRFWRSLEDSLFEKKIEDTKKLIQAYASFHINSERYPIDFGSKIRTLLISTPKSLTAVPNFLPLLPKANYIKLIQYTTEEDHEDISLLHDALYLTHSKDSNVPAPEVSDNQSVGSEALLDTIAKQIEAEYYNSQATRIYDEARIRFIWESVVVSDHTEFVDFLTSFYTHMIRHTAEFVGKPEVKELQAEALMHFEKLYPGKEYKIALAHAKSGTQGGLRAIADNITEDLKEKARHKYILAVFKRSIDPLNFKEKLSLIEDIIQRVSNELPDDLKDRKPEEFAEDYEDLVMTWVLSKQKIVEKLRAL